MKKLFCISTENQKNNFYFREMYWFGKKLMRNFFYLKTKFHLSSMYSPLVFMTSVLVDHECLWCSIPGTWCQKAFKVQFLGPLRFQNFYPLNNCKTC